MGRRPGQRVPPAAIEFGTRAVERLLERYR
jgi:hypothetical protein